MIKRYLGVSLITASMLVAGCSSDDDNAGTTTPPVAGNPTPLVDPYVVDVATVDSIADIAGGDDFTTLLALVTTAELDAALADATAAPITVFAPTNAAFTAFTDANPTFDTTDPIAVKAVLDYHILAGGVFTNADITARAGVTDNFYTMSSDEVATLANGVSGISIDGANISGFDNFATNGVVHVIDAVMTPPEEPVTMEPPTATGDGILAALTAQAGYEKFAALVGSVNGGEPTAALTFFAVPDTAYDAALALAADETDFYQSHAVVGTITAADLADGRTEQQMANNAVAAIGAGGTIGGANIVTSDVPVASAVGGALHLLDAAMVFTP